MTPARPAPPGPWLWAEALLLAVAPATLALGIVLGPPLRVVLDGELGDRGRGVGAMRIVVPLAIGALFGAVALRLFRDGVLKRRRLLRDGVPAEAEVTEVTAQGLRYRFPDARGVDREGELPFHLGAPWSVTAGDALAVVYLLDAPEVSAPRRWVVPERRWYHRALLAAGAALYVLVVASAVAR